ncbi:MAG: TonB-dependent receptor [Terriglobales bacterium]
MKPLRLLGLFVLLFVSIQLLAQTQITTGVIQGTLVDPSGAVIPGASVEVRKPDTNFTRTQVSDSNGRFVFLALPPGNYKLTASAKGFATMVNESLNLTVGQAISLNLSMKVSAAAEQILVTDTPTLDTTRTEESTTLSPITVSTTPVLGRKFEDLLTLTPGVSIVQGPDGDEINFAGQRGIFNNISLDGGDYNNGFFGEQMGGQRAAIDITMEAVQEFQVVATGANAEFGRTAVGVVNVVTKSGTNNVHGSLFHFQRLEALSSDTSDGKPLKDFSREQFGGTVGGPIIKNKMFFFGAVEQIVENLTRDNLSAPIGATPCPVQAPTILANEGIINSNPDCQRLALINFMKTTRDQDEGLPVKHPVRNTAVLGKYDWNLNSANKLTASYNFDRSRNTNQTFDVPTYGDSANGIEGTSLIQVINANLFTTVSGTKLNEAHFTYSRENRPRESVASNVPADTAMGFATSFRFGNPFFLQPKVDELFWRTQLKDNFSILAGKHNVKIGGEWIHSNNGQVFRGFFTGRYIFDSVSGFLHYASPASLGNGFGPSTGECSNGSFVNLGTACPGGRTATDSPLQLYLQHAATSGPTTDATGAAYFTNENFALFIQDKWQILPNFTLNYGLRWEAQLFPNPVIPPSQTAYGVNLSDPRFPSDGRLPSDTAMFQPRVGFSWDIRNNQKSVLRASFGIYNATQNMLTQVGPITTNGVQQQVIFAGDVAGVGFLSPSGPAPVWPNVIVPPVLPSGSFPFQPGITVFNRKYRNPRIYSANAGYEQELAPGWSGYLDLTWSKGVYLTRFVNPNTGSTVSLPANGDTVAYSGPKPWDNLGDVTDTQSSAHSLYRGMTIGARKRFSKGFQLEANYTLSEDLDDDSNERDPFTFRYFNRFDFRKDYSFSDRDERHKFNFYIYGELPWHIQANIRMQAHSAQPITDNVLGDRSGEPCSASNSITRVVNGVDCGRNHLRKDNAFFSFDWCAMRPIRFGDRYALIPIVEMFNTFNNKNNVNPLVSPPLFNFDGFLRQGVGDPRQVQLAVKFTF